MLEYQQTNMADYELWQEVVDISLMLFILADDGPEHEDGSELSNKVEWLGKSLVSYKCTLYYVVLFCTIDCREFYMFN